MVSNYTYQNETMAPGQQARPYIAIVAGGHVNKQMLTQLHTFDYVIGVDRGALYLIQQHIYPNLAIGDFDSVSKEEREYIRAHSQIYSACDAVDKNHTDTELAFYHALAMNPQQITLFGATGTRLDHTLANIHLLRIALDKGIYCQIIDNHNIVMLINKNIILKREPYPYISFLPLSLTVTGITLTGCKYPLHQATLHIGQTLAVSNEWEAEEIVVRIQAGYLLIIYSRDK